MSSPTPVEPRKCSAGSRALRSRRAASGPDPSAGEPSRKDRLQAKQPKDPCGSEFHCSAQRVISLDADSGRTAERGFRQALALHAEALGEPGLRPCSESRPVAARGPS
jgi:hypothetical protein